MEPQNHGHTDWIDAELRELFDSAIADAERTIDVDERHRQWLVGSQLRSTDSGSSPTGNRVGWRNRRSWPKLLPAGTVAAAAVVAVALFPYLSSQPQRFTVVNDDSELVSDPAGGIRRTPEPGADSKPLIPSTSQPEQTTSTAVGPSSTEGNQPTPSTTRRTTTLPSTTLSSTTLSSTTVSSTVPPTTPTATAPSTTRPSTTVSTTTTATTRPSDSEPPAESTSTTSNGSKPPDTTTSTSTVAALQMVVAIEATDPSGNIVPGASLESELLIASLKDDRFILPQQCQQVGLNAPPGYRFGASEAKPGKETKTIEICPNGDDPSELTIFEIVSRLAN